MTLASLLVCASPAWAGSDAASTTTAGAAARPRVAARSSAGTTSLEQSDRGLAVALAWLASHPTASGHLAVATEYRRLGVVDAAMRHVDAARVLAPTDAGAWDLRARLWRDAGLPVVALADAYRAVSLAPASSSAANTLGTVFAATGNSAAARVWYRRGLALDPQASYIVSNLCYASVVDPHTDSVGACVDAVRRAPGSPIARNNLALAYASTGNLDAARLGFAAGNASPGAVEFNMGLVHLAVGDLAAATRAFEAAFMLNPALRTADNWAAWMR